MAPQTSLHKFELIVQGIEAREGERLLFFILELLLANYPFFCALVMALSEQTFASVVFSGKLFDVQFSQEESSEGLERRGFIPHNANVADSISLVAVVFSTKVQKRLQVTLRLSHFWLSCQTAVAKLGEWSKDATQIL